MPRRDLRGVRGQRATPLASIGARDGARGVGAAGAERCASGVGRGSARPHPPGCAGRLPLAGDLQEIRAGVAPSVTQGLMAAPRRPLQKAVGVSRHPRSSVELPSSRGSPPDAPTRRDTAMTSPACVSESTPSSGRTRRSQPGTGPSGRDEIGRRRRQDWSRRDAATARRRNNGPGECATGASIAEAEPTPAGHSCEWVGQRCGNWPGGRATTP
jgi:hypothetical protein